MLPARRPTQFSLMTHLRALLSALAALAGLSPSFAQTQIPATAPGRLSNISARAFTGSGDNVLIAGFVLSGTNSRTMLLRAVGPGLAPFGVAGHVLDPELRLYRSGGYDLGNDTWGADADLVAAYRRLGAFNLVNNSKDAALLIPLSPGIYTAHARGRSGGTGEVLLELYDAARPEDDAPAIVNVSLRGEIGGANPLLIGGFVITPGAPKRLLLRAIGPSLATLGLAGATGNPRMRLFSGSEPLLTNDDWATGSDPAALEQAARKAGAFPIDRASRDAALLVALPPGVYTVHIDDADAGRGVVLFEVYDLEPPGPGDTPPPAAGGDAPAVSILALNERITEGLTPGATVMVMRSGDLSSPLRVALQSGGTASPDDYTGVPAQVTIPAGSASATFIVGAWTDYRWEPTEILDVSLVPGTAYTIAGTGTAHLIIRDTTAPTGTGWLAEYFNNRTVSGAPVLTRTDAEINFSWGGNAPAAELPRDNFSARWTGYIQVDTTQAYTFVARTDDGVRLWIDDQLLIDRWVNQGARDWTATVNLAAGVRYAVRMEYYDSSGTATAILSWQAAGMPRAVFPANRVYQATSVAPAITSPIADVALVGGPYHYRITAAPTAWSYGASGLPPGLSLDPATGVISGTPVAPGSYSIFLTAVNAQGTGAELLNLSVISTGAAPVPERWTAAASGFEIPAADATPGGPLGSLASDAPGGVALERIRGYITAPETGNYTFWISASGPAEFWLADSEQPGDRVRRAAVPAASPAAHWDADPAQQSMWIALTAGRTYYFDIVHRPAAAGAHVAVAWRRPTAAADAAPEIVPGYALSRFNAFAPVEEGKVLYLGMLRPEPGVASPASGIVSMLFDEAARTAVVSLRFSGLSAEQTSTYIYVGDVGQTGPQIRSLPNGQVTSFTWQMRDSGSLTAADLADALRSGLIYVVVHTTSFPGGELRAQLGAAAGTSHFVAPSTPPPLPGGAPTTAEASRFLQQATFGPTQAEIDRVRAIGVQAWLDEQFALEPSYHLPALEQKLLDLRATNPDAGVGQQHRREIWWQRAVHAPDQLRQRVAFALSEIFVVSDASDNLGGEAFGLTWYYDMLQRNAFGNFRTLLEDVTRSPAMAIYLSMLRNQKPDPARGIYPDENYAREVMQLFSIGLNKLHPDGTLVLDTHGLPIPTYTQETISGLAHVFTGWSYASAETTPNFLYGTRDMLTPLQMYESYHDTGDKRVLESWVIPGGASGESDLQATLDMLFQHPNVGPFLGRQLIQRLVTSNPSPGYVHRVARVFDDNGAGVRGDLGAVVRAILLDYEARSATAAANPSFGKLREPLVRLASLWRAFGAVPGTSGTYSYPGATTNFGQSPLSASTVFNFFEPGYVSPGLLAAANLVAPEFQITTATTVVLTSNALRSATFGNLSGVTLDLTAANALAGDPAGLVDWLDTLLMGGSMSPGMRSTVIDAVTRIPATTANERARTAINLVTISPEYAIQK